MNKAALEMAWQGMCELVDKVREQERASELAPRVRRAASSGATLKVQVDAYERTVVADVLHVYEGNVTNAARELGITREGLHKVMRRHGLTRGGS